MVVWPGVLRLGDARLGHMPRIAVENDPQLVELGIGHGDLGQHGIRVAALPGNRLGQRHGAGPDGQQIGHGILLRIDRLELGRRPLDRDVGAADLA